MTDWYDKELESFDRQVEMFDRKAGIFNSQFGSQYDELCLESDGLCPCCGNEELSIINNRYYCCVCAYPRGPKFLYSKGYPHKALPDWAKVTYPKKIIDVESYQVTHDKTYPIKDNVIPFAPVKRSKICALPEKVKVAHGSLAGILPLNYEACSDCNYDHEYDRGPAKRWHQAHPECGTFICGDDLICDD